MQTKEALWQQWSFACIKQQGCSNPRRHCLLHNGHSVLNFWQAVALFNSTERFWFQGKRTLQMYIIFVIVHVHVYNCIALDAILDINCYYWMFKSHSNRENMQYREMGSNRKDKNRFLFRHTGSGKHLYGFWLHKKSCMFADGETRFQFSLKMLIPIVLGFHIRPLIPSSFPSHLDKQTSSQYSLHLKLKSMHRVRKISWLLNSTHSKQHPLIHLLA